ncbi:reverse transcriptase domain-containing protein [Tanacetum coccineum]|uniref:Reverse transcriptase domain-containing protein n=1 Tax=Tanacetum coccineum TaxID=301880 RepID=A0ABQ4WFU5_9ASTR
MKMSAMANTSPIVTTVTKPTTKEKTPKEADATPRVNIQDFCEEHYEDILLVIMDKIRRDKRKEVPCLGCGLRRIVHKKCRLRLFYQRSTKHGYRVALTETTPFFEKMGGKVESPSSSFPAYQKAIPAMGDIGSQGAKKYGLLSYLQRAVDGYKDLKARCLLSILHATKEVETERIKGALECMRISRFMHGVNNPELTKRLNEHVPKTMEEMMITTTCLLWEKLRAGKQEKVHTSDDKAEIESNSKRYRTVSVTIKFPSLTTSSGQKVFPRIIEAEGNWSLSPYNGIIGRPGIREIQAVPSTALRMLKFLVNGGMVTIYLRSAIGRDATYRERTDRTMFTPEEKLGHIRMETVRHDRSTTINSGTSTQYPRRVFARSTEENEPVPRACESHLSGESDEEKTAFHTSQGVYCYAKMPFGLKNAGSAYQRLVDKAFDSHVGKNIEVYIDDLVIKSHTKAEMLRDIDETFCTLRKINMKLNPKKCTFGAVEGMFLGYMISLEGIKPCPDKTEALLQLPSPRIIKEVQSLNGKLASLNRFLSKSAESLQATKAALVRATSAGSTQAKGGNDCSTLSPPMELLVRFDDNKGRFRCRSTSLRMYFQAHPIAVVTDQLIKQIISRPDVAGRLQKYSVHAGEHNITTPRMS